MDPVTALNEIAYLLERERASEFKTKAFRTAATVLATIPTDQRQEQVADGTLKKTKGIGNSTYEVIVEALDGKVPVYLEDARERAAKPLVEGEQTILPQLLGDLHTHSEWSDGTTPIELMVETAKWLGREYIALTDHSP